MTKMGEAGAEKALQADVLENLDWSRLRSI